MSLVNAALGATMRAISTSIPQVRPVVVSADDMGNSLDREMMDDEAEGELDQLPLRVSDLAISQATDPDSGCSTGSVAAVHDGGGEDLCHRPRDRIAREHLL